jgi:KaiC/GvpD/RAD55 family RecA-like ATPase
MKTGIEVIDSAGGLPEGSNVLLIGPPGPEKVTLSLRLLGEVLKGGGKGIYVTTDQLPADIESKSKPIADISGFTGKSLWFVDCYSWTLGTPPAGRTDVLVPGPSALNDLSIGVTQSVQKAADSPKLIFQSVSTLLLYNSPEIVFRFYQITGARLKVSGATTLFHCESAMHDERTITTLKHLSDVVIELRADGGKTMLTAPAIGIKDWREVML